MTRTLIPLFGVIVALLIMVSTGASSSVSADRPTSISVMGDDSALVGLTPTSSYAFYVNGQMTIGFDEMLAGGVNPDSVTAIDDIFRITNNGSKPLNVTLSKGGDNPLAISFGQIEGGIVLLPGEHVSISVSIDSQGLMPNEGIIDEIFLSAAVM